MKPVILVTAEEGFDRAGNDHFVVSHHNTRAVTAAGGIPATPLDIRLVKEYAAFADGLFLTDGSAIHPGRYGSIYQDLSKLRGFSGTRDDLEFALAEAFLAAGKPILGIGRGRDILSVLQTGALPPKSADDPPLEVQLQNLVSEAGNHSGVSSLPLVALDGGPAIDDFYGEAGTVLNKTYTRAFASNGALPFLVTEEEAAGEYANIFAGLSITGSQFYAPDKPGDERDGRERLRHRETERESFEASLFRAFTQVNKPIFGICLGLQRINVFLGGTLKPNFKFEEGVEHLLTKHSVTTKAGSILRRFFGETFSVNSRHNIRLDALAPGLIVTARSPDGVIEAFEHERLPVHAVQWHPERMRGEIPEPPDGPAMDPLFQDFTTGV